MSKLVEKYFSILEDYFNPLLDWISKRGYSSNEHPRAVGEVYDPILARSMLDSLYEELARLDWLSQESAIAKTRGLKASYIGYHFQDSSKVPDFLKKTCLYSDTAILVDHILSELLTWRKRETGEYMTFMIIAQNAIDYLGIREMFRSDLDPPICTLAPPMIWSLERRNSIDMADHLVWESTLSFASDVFGQGFDSREGLDEFLSKIEGFDEFVLRAKNPEMLTTASGTSFSAKDLERAKRYYQEKYLMEVPQLDMLEAPLRARFPAIIYNIISNAKFTSSFITDLRGVWNDLKWLLKKDNESIFAHFKKPRITKDMLIQNTLQRDELRWLGGVPIDKLIELRERGELQDLRDIIGRNVMDMQNAKDEDFVEVENQVGYNLDQAFKKHSSEVQSLEEEFRRKYKIDAASVIVSGSLALISAYYPPFAQVAGIVGGGSILKTARDFLEEREKLKDLKKKPVALLFGAKRKAQAEESKG